MKLNKNEFWVYEVAPALMGFLCGAAVVILGLFGLMRAVEAATYNVLFNNVEQGANSTSSPSVHVADGKAVRSEGGTPTTIPVTVESSPAAAVAPAPQQTVGASTENVVAPTQEHYRRVRLALAGTVLGQRRSDLSNGTPWGGSLSASYFFLDDLGVNILVGWNPGRATLAGADLEFIPLHATFFGRPRFLEASALMGVSTLGRSHDLWGSVHAGARATVNFSDRYGVSSTVRTNLTGRSSYDYVLAEVGLTVRL